MSSEHHLRDQDLVRWIENKLGSHEIWGGLQASSMLTKEMLIELETCFQVEIFGKYGIILISLFEYLGA